MRFDSKNLSFKDVRVDQTYSRTHFYPPSGRESVIVFEPIRGDRIPLKSIGLLALRADGEEPIREIPL